jgi:hypothetical protein
MLCCIGMASKLRSTYEISMAWWLSLTILLTKLSLTQVRPTLLVVSRILTSNWEPWLIARVLTFQDACECQRYCFIHSNTSLWCGGVRHKFFHPLSSQFGFYPWFSLLDFELGSAQRLPESFYVVNRYDIIVIARRVDSQGRRRGDTAFAFTTHMAYFTLYLYMP